MKTKMYAMTMTTFSLADFPSGERVKLENQIMERALARWRSRQSSRLTAFNSLRQRESKPRHV
jgi:hypothetical protein